ncbi:hypothetical protein TKK_0001906 [Trichogramma kaykai]|uniref:Glucose-methanol-choline oxidoreductase C-terminal domain-containing protein n=1 Tax=Trichogramma kaykai TaxID=54128 RepID=A0ABD2X487_9HYME
MAFLNIDNPHNEDSVPDVEILLTILSKKEFYFLPILIQPKSRGQVLLKSSNPKDDPVVVPNYFSEKDDVEKDESL